MDHNIIIDNDKSKKMTMEEFQEGLKLLREKRDRKDESDFSSDQEEGNIIYNPNHPYNETTVKINRDKPSRIRPLKIYGHIKYSILYPSVYCNFCYLIYIIIIIILASYNVYCISNHGLYFHESPKPKNICAYFYPYKQGYKINNYLYYTGKNWSLHGWWPESRKGHLETKLCLSYENFTKLFMETALAKYLLDGDKYTYKCCHFQYHEYWKHGCLMGYTYYEWYNSSLECLSVLKAERERHITHWHFCDMYNCNIVLQTTNSSTINDNDIQYCFNHTSC